MDPLDTPGFPRKDPLDIALYDRYLAGECSPDEAERVRQALGARVLPDTVVQTIARREGREVPAVDVDTRWEAMVRRLVDGKGTEERRQGMIHGMAQARAGRVDAKRVHFGRQTLRRTFFSRQTLRHTVLGYGIGIGAIAAIMLCAHHTELGMRSEFRPSMSAEYATVVGQRATVALPDGSTAVLAPQSRLQYEYRTGASAKLTVRLSGEALFTVTRATAVPFIVNVGDMSVRVLGTTFGVRRYVDDCVTEVVVVSGRVIARNRRGIVTLSAGQGARVTDSTVSAAEFDVRSYRAWTRGELVFSHTPVPAMLATLGRWYGYEFHLTDSALVNRHVTAVFKASAVRETLSEIEELLDVTMRFDGKIVTLQAREKRARQEHWESKLQRTEVGR